MSNYANAKAYIDTQVYSNHANQVTAPMVNNAIKKVIDTIIAGGYLYKGIAHPGDAAVSVDANVFYLATEAGTYTNKGGLVVADGEVAVLKYNGSWTKEVTGAATAAQVSALGHEAGELDLVRQIDCGAIEMERGDLAWAGGNLVSDKRIRSAGAISTPLFLCVPNGYWISVVYYYSSWTSAYNNTVAQRVTVNARTYQCAATYPYCRFSIRKEDGSVFATNEFLTTLRSALNPIKNGAAALDGIRGVLTGIIRDGGVGNYSNTWKVASSCIDIRGRLSRQLTLYTDRPVDAGATYYFGVFFTSSEAAINDEFGNNLNPYSYPIIGQVENKVAGEMIQIPDNAVGVLVEVYEVPAGGSAGDIILRASDFSGYSLGVQLAPVVENLESLIKTGLALGGENVTISGANLRNGSVGNDGNAYCIASKYRVDVSDVTYIGLYTNRPNSPNCVYRWIYSTFASASGLSTNSSDRLREFSSYAGNDYPIVFGLNPNEKGFAVGIVEYNTSTQSISALRTTDFIGYYLGVIKFERGVLDNILSRLSSAENTIYNIGAASSRYLEKAGALYQACRYHSTSATEKDLQLQIITDIHSHEIPLKNAVAIAPAFETIDATICLGDVQDSNFADSFKTKFAAVVASSAKPFYMCLGNHDVGNSKYIGFCATHQQAFDAFIKPVIDAGFLAAAEYESGKSYYYHDFTAPKIRLIVLNEYDEPLDFDTTYWTPVSYDATAPVVALNTAYSANDIVRVNGYTAYSFKCVQAVTTPSSFYAALAEQIKFPSYRIERGTRVIRQTQAQWFLDTLASTPANYGVVVATHNPFSENSRNQRQYKFAQDIDFVATALMQNSMETDFIANAVNAFILGSNYSENVIMKGDASYLNTQGGGTYAYSVGKDFSVKNAGVKFLCYIGGHSHRDLIMKHDTFVQYQVTPICASLLWANNNGNDIKRRTTDGFGVDSLTVISFDKTQKVRLVKVGVDVTTEMTLRDQELIDLTS